LYFPLLSAFLTNNPELCRVWITKARDRQPQFYASEAGNINTAPYDLDDENAVAVVIN